MTFITRAEWGARPPTSNGNLIGAHPLGVAVHYSEGNLGSTPDALCDDKVRGIQNYHMDTKGWADIAYSFLVCPHGNVFEGRGTGKGSAANGTTQGNLDWYAVCALGGPADTPSVLMLAAIGDAIALCREAGAGPRVIGHRDLFPTACPGAALYAYVQAARWTGVGPRPPVTAPAPVAPIRPIPAPTGGLTVRTIDLRNASTAHPVTSATAPGMKPLQRLLGITADGIGGDHTRWALGEQQRVHGVTRDFIFGINTANAFLSK